MTGVEARNRRPSCDDLPAQLQMNNHRDIADKDWQIFSVSIDAVERPPGNLVQREPVGSNDQLRQAQIDPDNRIMQKLLGNSSPCDINFGKFGHVILQAVGTNQFGRHAAPVPEEVQTDQQEHEDACVRHLREIA